MTIRTYGDGYDLVEGGSLLYSVFKIKHISDVLRAVDITRLSGINDVDAFHIEIANVKLECRSIDNIYD